MRFYQAQAHYVQHSSVETTGNSHIHKCCTIKVIDKMLLVASQTNVWLYWKLG